MKAISVWQPFASLIVEGGLKEYETRSWVPYFRGRLAIHAAKNMYPSGRAQFERSPFAELLIQMGYKSWDDLPRGAIVGIVSLEHVYGTNLQLPRMSEMEKALGDFSVDRYAWHLTDPFRFQVPRPAKGKQGLWYWDDGAEGEVAVEIKEKATALQMNLELFSDEWVEEEK